MLEDVLNSETELPIYIIIIMKLMDKKITEGPQQELLVVIIQKCFPKIICLMDIQKYKLYLWVAILKILQEMIILLFLLNLMDHQVKSISLLKKKVIGIQIYPIMDIGCLMDITIKILTLRLFELNMQDALILKMKLNILLIVNSQVGLQQFMLLLFSNM